MTPGTALPLGRAHPCWDDKGPVLAIFNTTKGKCLKARTRDGMVFKGQKCTREGLFLHRYFKGAFYQNFCGIRYMPIFSGSLTLLTSKLYIFASNTKTYKNIFAVILEGVYIEGKGAAVPS